MKNILLFAIGFVVLQSCSSKSGITNEKDYQVFLDKKFVHKLKISNDRELAFWKSKLTEDTGSFVYKMQIGDQYLSDFKITGSIDNLRLADSLFGNSAAKLNHTEPVMYFTLAQNAITQHRFKEAAHYLAIAEKNNPDPYTVQLLKFDINMELGNYPVAEKALFTLAGRSKNFDYIIRKAKYEDHLGNSEQSILEMEKAYKMVQYVNKKSLQNWVSTNLADMYSHAGRLEDAYRMYLTALQSDSANLYALKGIAAICFVQDHNTKAAEKIYQFILSNTKAPDVYLQLAEISKWKKDPAMEKMYQQQFLAAMENPAYGNMYNKYLIELYLQEPAKSQKALLLAEKEIENRATPETYSWLAMANYKTDHPTKAAEIFEQYVLHKTKEPHASYTGAIIYNSSNPTLATSLAKLCEESSFELGPIKMQELKTREKAVF